MKRIFIIAGIILTGILAIIGLVFLDGLQDKLPSTVVGSDDEIVFDTDDGPMAIAFSLKDTFFDKSIEVKISCADKNAVIYYTDDGTTPSAEKGKLYKEPISISAGNEVKATTLKAIALNGEDKSEIANKSYIVGKNVFERFSDSTYVFILSTDPYNLYDYYYGVATEGYLRDEYLESDDYDGGELPYNAPANWYISGRESERDMYVEVYNSQGEKLIDQAAGGRVVGGYSRAASQKSWRLIARNEYSEGNGKFEYTFFSGAVDAYGQLITEYDRITLRNNANDREFASIRDEVAQQLAADAGFPDIQQTTPAAVFLNSEYYGFAWLHEAFSNSYLEMTYGGERDNFRIVGGTESEVEGDDEQSVNDYNKMLSLVENGLTSDDKFTEFCEMVDIDNLIQYYAIQIYIANKDWPGNNFKVWRYYPSENEEITSPYLDGKWRFLLFDVEYAMGLYGDGFSARTLSDVLNGTHMQGGSEILLALLERKDMQEKFTNAVCDLVSGAFSYENASDVIEEKIALSDSECFYALDNGYTSDWASRDTFYDSRQQIKEFFKNRPKVIFSDIESNFDLNTEKYNIQLTNTIGGEAFLNTQTLSEEGTVSGDYYSEYSVFIKAETYSGYEFDHWDINGKSYVEQALSISADDAAAGKIAITAYYKKTVSDTVLYINKLYTAGDGDWIELFNPNSTGIVTGEYYLSDDELELNKWRIPVMTVGAESSVTIVCKNNKENSALLKLTTNFNLKLGETLYLSDINGNIISKAEVVDMTENEFLVRNLDGTYSIQPLESSE